MKLDELKKGLWGFQKASVYAYITMAEEEFSAKLAEKDSRHEASEEQYRSRIDALEQELHTVKEQLEQQRSEKLLVAKVDVRLILNHCVLAKWGKLELSIKLGGFATIKVK